MCIGMEEWTMDIVVEAASRERQSLFGLRLLISQTAETLFLWTTAVTHGIHEVSRREEDRKVKASIQVTLNMGEEARREIASTRLAQLATNPALNSIVIKSLIEYVYSHCQSPPLLSIDK